VEGCARLVGVVWDSWEKGGACGGEMVVIVMR
jgi:hypothetical protein